MQRLAIFDFDGTLSRVNSYHVFLHWLITRPSFSSPLLASAILARRLRLISRPALMTLALSQLKNWKRSQLEALGRSLFDEKILPHLNPAGLAELQKRREEGFRIVVLSAGFDFLLRPFCETHQIEEWQSSRIAFNGDYCLGQLEGAEFRGEEKLRYLQKQYGDGEIDWKASCAYSDELVDLPILSAVGNGFLVNHCESDPLPSHVVALEWK